jgi:hypothetical protein
MKITFTGLTNDAFISSIKTCRELTGKGIKESKEIMEDVRRGKKRTIETNVGDGEALRILEGSNVFFFIVEEETKNGIESLKNCAILFIKDDRVDIAIELLKLVKKV